MSSRCNDTISTFISKESSKISYPLDTNEKTILNNNKKSNEINNKISNLTNPIIDNWIEEDELSLSNSFDKYIQIDNTTLPPPPNYQDETAGMYLTKSIINPSIPIDTVLMSCLDNDRERLTVLKYEDNIVKFVQNKNLKELIFPPISSYHRLVVHRLAQRFSLAHQSMDIIAPYDNGNSIRGVTLYKTENSSVPQTLLIHLSCERQEQLLKKKLLVGTNPTFNTKRQPKLMIRKRKDTKTLSSGPNNGTNQHSSQSQQKMILEREKAYEEARKRIFGGGEDTSNDDVPLNNDEGIHTQEIPNTDDKTLINNNMNENKKTDDITITNGLTNAEKNKKMNKNNNNNTDKYNNYSIERNKTTGTKAQWRNREQEIKDPDFTRRNKTNINYNNNMVYCNGPPVATPMHQPIPMPAYYDNINNNNNNNWNYNTHGYTTKPLNTNPTISTLPPDYLYNYPLCMNHNNNNNNRNEINNYNTQWNYPGHPPNGYNQQQFNINDKSYRDNSPANYNELSYNQAFPPLGK